MDVIWSIKCFFFLVRKKEIWLDFLLSNQAEIKECPPYDGAEEDKYEENRKENQEKYI